VTARFFALGAALAGVVSALAAAHAPAPAVAHASEISLRAPSLRLPPSQHPDYHRGLKLDLRGDHAGAAQAYRASGADPATSPRARFHGKLSETITTLREALRRAPDSYDDHFNYAVNVQNKYWALFLDAGVRDHRLGALAEHHFKESMRLSPISANPLLCLAALYAQAGDRPKAAEVYATLGVRVVRPSDYYNLAFFHKVMGDMEEAFRVLRMAMAFDTRHREWVAESDDFADHKDDPRLQAILKEGVPHGGSLGQLRMHRLPRWSLKPRLHRIMRNLRPGQHGPSRNPFPTPTPTPMGP